MAEDLANSPLGLHTAQVSKPLVVQHLLLPAGPPHAGTLVAQPHPLDLHWQTCQQTAVELDETQTAASDLLDWSWNAPMSFGQSALSQATEWLARPICRCI